MTLTDLQDLRDQAMSVVKSLSCAESRFKELTGVDFEKFENFAYGFTNPKRETIQKYKDAIQYMTLWYKGEIHPRDLFNKFYIEKMTTKDIADDYETDEHIIVKLMRKNPRSRRAILRTLKGRAA